MRSVLFLLAAVLVSAGATVVLRKYSGSGLQDKTFTQNVLFSSPAKSTVHCAVLCNQHESCETFTFEQDLCGGHALEVTPDTSYVFAAGARSYSKKKLAPWLESSCSSDADCPDDINAECFNGKCLCTPGYYYSNGQEVCVEDCPVSDQLSEFLAYPDSYMDVPPVETPADNVEDCLDACAADSSCITVDVFFPDKTCYTNSFSPRLDPSKLITNYPAYSLYQQRCA